MNALETPDALLNTVYEQLELSKGDLYDATEKPSKITEEEWINKGEWLSLAKSVGVEKVFFVKSNPVIVFAKVQDKNDEAVRNLFNNVWCMSRPSLLFLASPGELKVYDLTQSPIRSNDKIDDHDRLLDSINISTEVISSLYKYHKEKIESGLLFQDQGFKRGKHRADEALIRDLKIVRRELIRKDLDVRYAHSLIARSIFIRYLEDREILTSDYFFKIADQEKNNEWKKILESEPKIPYAEQDMGKLFYFKILSDKSFTYRVFQKLKNDFNGDMFSSENDEFKNVTQEHLNLLKDFLTGSLEQYSLFFFAYKFNIIPVELISSIYEEFYHSDKVKERDKGTYYTPSTLVDFLLSQVLTPEILAKNPRILDPSCGSGIFLVESFKRIVRHRIKRNNGNLPNREELLWILKNQIAGIDIDPDAVHIAAFSLYLAFLHYQKPPDILEDKRLPKLICCEKKNKDKRDYIDCLLVGNSFNLPNNIKELSSHSFFSNNCADIIVGNPPWGEPSKENLLIVNRWCQSQKPPKIIGDNEMSQAFVHRSIDLLNESGIAALLLSTGVFFKFHSNSKRFRKQWLETSKFLSVFNFIHTRKNFFSKAVAPFAAVIFQKISKCNENNRFEYWSIKNTASMDKGKCVILSKEDCKVVSQNDMSVNDALWKIYWWGGHKDAILINSLKMETALNDQEKNNEDIFVDIGRGFEERSGELPSEEIIKFKELPAKYFKSYGHIDLSLLNDIPKKIGRIGNLKTYEGLRILIKGGISQRGDIKGRILTRLETKTKFSFRDSIIGLRLQDGAYDEAKILIGILWSSLTRYFLFMTSSQWGIWHDKIQVEEIQNIPIRFPDEKTLKNRISSIVDDLIEYNGELLNGDLTYVHRKEQELDEAIFDLYKLTPSERDLINEMCKYGLDLLYRNYNSEATKPFVDNRPNKNCGLQKDIPSKIENQNLLEGYLYTFLNSWNKIMKPDGEFSWERHYSPNKSMLAIVFSSRYLTDKKTEYFASTWSDVLDKINRYSYINYGSDKIFIEGSLRYVSETDIVFIKRNQVRFWTRSMAREDVESTILEAMRLQNTKKGINFDKTQNN